MASKDIGNQVKLTPALNPGAAITGNSATNGTTIDTQGFESAAIAVQSGTITDGAFALKLQEGDQSNLSDAADVAQGDYNCGYGASFAATDDNVVKKLGYRGAKRYIRVVLTQSGATSGGIMGAVAILGNARNAPVA
jgi:hypothetical protein